MGSRVSARVPDELRFQVDRKLEVLGSNATQLVNAAYEYVLKTGELPVARELPEAAETPAMDEVTRILRERVSATTCEVPESYFGDKSYDQILEEELYEAYTALS